ncbi:MAG: ABC-ATPase domain-containing protein [Clostridiaceae bacterium]|nr:ABC-ATPase domain-containing protein [Clostridiaceae bacterium]
MKRDADLRRILHAIDGKGYKAYKDIEGQYKFDSFVLSIDHVQGDPFASPTKARVVVPMEKAGFPPDLYDKAQKNTGVCDFLARVFYNSIKKYYNSAGGTGKSGMLIIDRCGQEILARTSVVIDNSRVEARFEVGLPAQGRRILGKAADFIFSSALPVIAENSLYYKNIDAEKLREHVRLVEDQFFMREEIKKRGLVAFINNGAILPRESGVSDLPMKKGAVPFKSPETLEIELQLPNKGLIKGMGIPAGVTLIAGGGYHGKSTLLKALERGVYNHIAGDGREYVVTIEDAVKIRAEDGRRVEKVNISPFINNLPNSQDTREFSTDNASGSTSQAANIMEALEIGTSLLLVDEDTSATNFMIRDGRMQRLVAREKEPITPFIDRVRQLYTEYGVSTILVVGGSGDYFDVADTVIMMDEYVPKDVTVKAKEIASSTGYARESSEGSFFGDITPRIILKSSFPRGKKGWEIKPKGLHTLLYNKEAINLVNVEQLVDASQTNCIAVMLQYMIENILDDRLTLAGALDKLYKFIQDYGLDRISPYKGHPGNLALPRKHELAAAINRYRGLMVKTARINPVKKGS